MICSNCGTQSPAGFAYCGSCGTRLAVAETAAAETRRQVAVLFADVVGFTALAEKLDPEELRSVVGSLLAELSAEVYAQGGRVDMYAGDSIMATFGAPVAHENDPVLACQTAFGMLEKVKAAVGAKTAPNLQIRIGINWGEVDLRTGWRQRPLYRAGRCGKCGFPPAILCRTQHRLCQRFGRRPFFALL